MGRKFEGFPFYLVVDFGYGKIRIIHPQKIVAQNAGQNLENFLKDI